MKRLHRGVQFDRIHNVISTQDKKTEVKTKQKKKNNIDTEKI